MPTWVGRWRYRMETVTEAITIPRGEKREIKYSSLGHLVATGRWPPDRGAESYRR